MQLRLSEDEIVEAIVLYLACKDITTNASQVHLSHTASVGFWTRYTATAGILETQTDTTTMDIEA